MLANLILLPLFLVHATSASSRHVRRGTHASSFAGATTSYNYPPTSTIVDSTYFPDASRVGYAGSTPTGDEALAIETAPAQPKIQGVYPLVAPTKYSTTQNSGDKFNIFRHWGNGSPMYSVDSFGLPEASAQIPDGCMLNQVHLLHRHGARYPVIETLWPGAFATKIHNASSSGSGFSASGDLSFLNTWYYKIGQEILTPFGRQEMYNLGVGLRVEYGHLLESLGKLPVFRTTSQDRLVDSALEFAAGFFGVRTYAQDYHQLIMVDGNDGPNNTLASSHACPNANKGDIGGLGTSMEQTWIAKYLQPATQRINSMLSGLELGATDVFEMQMICTSETVALGYSKFCDLFTEDEWRGFEYAWDIRYWYSYGPGQPTSAAQGIGYVQELVSRLTQTRITSFNSAVNSTIVSSEELFPLDQSIYVDATHDTTMTGILTALNFTSLAANGPLPTDHIPENQSYITSQFSPYGSRLVTQVLSCPAQTSGTTNATHIRFILNDAVVPLTGIKGCEADQNGLCGFSTFISAMEERIGEVDFAFDCNGNYTVPNPDTIIDGRYSR